MYKEKRNKAERRERGKHKALKGFDAADRLLMVFSTNFRERRRIIVNLEAEAITTKLKDKAIIYIYIYICIFRREESQDNSVG